MPVTEPGYSAAECLARAEQCTREAEQAAYEAQRYQLLWLAEQWRAMARLAGRTTAARRDLH